MEKFSHRVLITSRLIQIQKFILLLSFNKSDYAIIVSYTSLVESHTKYLVPDSFL